MYACTHLYTLGAKQTKFEHSLAEVHESFEFKSHNKHTVMHCSEVRVFIVAQLEQHFLKAYILSKVVPHV